MINKETDWLSSNQPIGSNWIWKQIQKLKFHPSFLSVCFNQPWGANDLEANLCQPRQVSLDGRMYQDLREILQAVDRLNK